MSAMSEYTYADLMKIVGAEIGGETMDSTTEAEREEARQSAQDTALDAFPGIEAAELFAALDEIAAAEFGISW